MNDLIISNAQNNDDFFSQLAALQNVAVSQSVRPAYYKMDGKTGQFYEQKWNDTEKKSERTELRSPIGVSILFVRWFAKQKYEEGSKTYFRTREFSSWDQPVELLKVENGNTERAGGFDSYSAFKEEYSTTDKLTGKTRSSFDLYASLYLYDWETEKIANFKCKGTSRSAVFDFLKTWKKGEFKNLKSISQALLWFSSVPAKGSESGMDYYSLKIDARAVLPVESENMIKEAVVVLAQWMKSFEKEKEEPDSPEATEASELPTIQLLEQEGMVIPETIENAPTAQIEASEATPATQTVMSWRDRAHSCTSCEEADKIMESITKLGLPQAQTGMIKGILESKGFLPPF